MRQHLKIALRTASIQGLILLLPILGNLFYLTGARADFKSNLTVNVDGLKNQTGKICASLFYQSKGFPSDSKKALQSQCVDITEKPQKLIFKNLKAGNYAVALIHDTNADGILNSNSFGIPTEGFGFSNNPLILTGPPKFNNAAVLVAGTNTDIQVQLQYLLGG
ncbi:DUF2141 domain-containing protein [Anabaena lutea]|uniref:DUF2141 domain-containing protein n=1 Tax=Anabaena lutea FACHB-196 TaxID=2692881 RepID=A0ABR8FI97_9NOST|nr:DUF2141 domain-containing protein [Anabaena lutea]MBD2569960.1 DUF2141 domain-containing protein [Anabaena lutea FACHB-196]